MHGGESDVLAHGPIRAALEAAARGAGLDDDTIPEYLASVRALVREMVAHGHGGILVIHCGEQPEFGESAPYRILDGASLASLLRLSKIITRSANNKPRVSDTLTFRQVLRGAFIGESER